MSARVFDRPPGNGSNAVNFLSTVFPRAVQYTLGHDRLHRGDGRHPHRTGQPSCGTRTRIRDRRVLVYDGKVYHGGGANRSDRVRSAINLTYAVGWLRQEENQFLSCPLTIARTLPDELLRLMGYQCGAFALGYVHAFEDPMTILGRCQPGKLVGAEMMLNAEQNEARRSFLREAEFG